MTTATLEQKSRGQDRHLCTEMHSRVRALSGTEVLDLTVHDISRSGIGLISCQPIPPNKPLLVEMYDHAKASSRLHATWAIHCTERDDGRWLVGCSFLRGFSEQEMASLLGKEVPHAI